MRFWLGSYTADLDGHAAGIGVLHSGSPDEQSPRAGLAFAGTAVNAESPSWLTAHPTLDVVYAALEGRGAVQAFRRSGDETLVAMGAPVVTGSLTCHLAFAPSGSSLLAASYGDGSVTHLALAADGSLNKATALGSANDPYAVEGANPPAGLGTGTRIDSSGAIDLAAAAAALRDAAGAEFAHLVPDYDQPEVPAAIVVDDPDARTSRAHHITFLPGGLMATTDLGFDLIRIWKGSNELQQIVLPKGSGPRHAVWHPSGHLYVVTEYSAEIYAIAPNREGEWRIITAIPVSRETSMGVDFPAEISLTRDALFLHVTVRGSNTVATIAIREGGARLEPVALVELGVDWPRHHIVVVDTLVVAGERSDEIVTLAVDARTGVVGQTLHRAHAPTPAMIVPIFE